MEMLEVTESAFVIKVKNKTDEKLFDVSLLNYEFKDQSKIEYEGVHTTYSLLLRQLSRLSKSDNLKITRIYLNARCDFDQFSIRQVRCALFESHTYFDGRKLSFKHDLLEYFSTEQVHKNMVDVSFENPISLTGLLDLQLEFLMPETEIYATIHFVKPIIQS